MHVPACMDECKASQDGLCSLTLRRWPEWIYRSSVCAGLAGLTVNKEGLLHGKMMWRTFEGHRGGTAWRSHDRPTLLQPSCDLLLLGTSESLQPLRQDVLLLWVAACKQTPQQHGSRLEQQVEAGLSSYLRTVLWGSS